MESTSISSDVDQVKTAEDSNSVTEKSIAESESEAPSTNLTNDNEDDESLANEEDTIVNPCPNVSASHVNFSIASINPHLVCPLCNGYFRDPYTITECLHTFCKSCLFFAFQTGFRQCPTCKTDLSPDPFRLVLSDRTLSTLVHKIFPYLDVQDSTDEREFYDRRGIKRKPEFRDNNQTKPNAQSDTHDEKPTEPKTPISVSYFCPVCILTLTRNQNRIRYLKQVMSLILQSSLKKIMKNTKEKLIF